MPASAANPELLKRVMLSSASDVTAPVPMPTRTPAMYAALSATSWWNCRANAASSCPDHRPSASAARSIAVSFIGYSSRGAFITSA
ncbi:MAG: hypothetical protein ACLUJ0_16755 [Ruthenibacterium lactatiformans]|uniref:hypothetical protein n=1 Tax=Ruthenibacterium lactatiformans TaxID=1550024 RepID=UPI00399286AC